MRLKAIVFDFNGTLVNDLELHVASYWRAGVDCGYPLSEETVRRYISFAPSEKRSLYYGEISNAEWEEVFSLKRKYYYELVDRNEILFPDTESALSVLAADFKLAVLSNTFRYMYERLCPAHLARLFQATLFYEEMPDPKPSPQPMLHIMEELGVDRNQCCYVGDSLTDLKMAKAAGVPMFGVTTGDNHAEEFKMAGADYVADDLTDLVRQLKSL